MEREEAEAFSKGLGSVVKGTSELILYAHRQGIPEAMGMELREWVNEYLGGYARLPIEERREEVLHLTAPVEVGGEGLDQREAASVLGVHESTVSRDLDALAFASEETSPEAQGEPVSLANASEETAPDPPPAFYTLSEWKLLDESERAAALALPRDPHHTFNKQEGDNIEWARWSWNAITGCLHNCSFCYARDIAERFYEHKFEPAFLPGRLDGPRNTKVPAQAARDLGYGNVFVGSMADLFGKWVPREWIEAVLAEVRANPQWNYLFLTKFPIRLREFSPFPDNAWMGTSVDAQARVKVAEQAFADVEAKVKWLSCEPLLEPLRFERLDLFQWVVIGGASRSSQTPEWRPPRSWADDLRAQARRAGCKVYEKTNLLERLREYPGAAEPERVSVPDAFRMPYLQRDVLEPDAYAAEMRG